MLERIDDVDWARITHAYGPATDVPDQIRDLRAADPDRREKARWQLYGNIVHQGTRYEATAFAVPFLLEVLADPGGPDKAELVLLLAALAVGHDEYWLPDGIPVAEHRRTAEGGAMLLAAAPHPGDEEWDEEGDAAYIEALTPREQEAMLAHVAVAAHEAVRRGVPLFRELLAHEHPAVRATAAYALAWFPEDAEGSLPALGPLATSEVDDSLAATARVSMGLLGVAAEFDDPRPVVRWATAVARTRVYGAGAGQEAVDELRMWASDAGRDEGVPFMDGDLVGYATLVLDRMESRPRLTVVR